jgi:hypothetical protein
MRLLLAAALSLALLPAAAAPAEPTSKELTAFARQAKAAAAARLKDPGSAQFRSLFVSRGRLYVNDVLTTPLRLCGEVNARNSFGGYVGFRRFVAWGGSPIVEKDDDGEAFGEVVWDRQCSAKLQDVR